MAETFWERANRLIKDSGFTQETFSKKCGFNSRRIQNLSGRNDMPKAEELLQMAKNLRTSTDYLFLGGDSLDEGEREILNAYNRLNEDGKKAALGAVRGLITDFPLPSEQVGELSKTAT